MPASVLFLQGDEVEQWVIQANARHEMTGTLALWRVSVSSIKLLTPLGSESAKFVLDSNNENV